MTKKKTRKTSTPPQPVRPLATPTRQPLPGQSAANDDALPDFARELLTTPTSANTARAYAHAERVFSRWTALVYHTPLTFPVHRNVVLNYIQHHAVHADPAIEAHLIAEGLQARRGPVRHSTLKAHLAWLAQAHTAQGLPNPVRDPAIKQVLRKLRKRYPERNSHKQRALTLDILTAMLDTCGDRLVDHRDRALLQVGFFSGGRRRTELAAIQLRDLDTTCEPPRLRIPHSKTDQEAKGFVVALDPLTLAAIAAWQRASGIKTGYLFRNVTKGGQIGPRLSDRAVHSIVRKRLFKAGYDPSAFGAHALRAGYVTEALRAGRNVGEVMAATGHRRLQTVLDYYRSVLAWSHSPETGDADGDDSIT